MAKEKLIIKNFGPIQSVELELGKITILIGEQASGKSTVAKVLAICRDFSYIVDNSVALLNYKSSFSNKALRDWGLGGFENEKSYIEYENSDYRLEVKYREEIIKDVFIKEDWKSEINVFLPEIFPKSERFKNLFDSYKNLLPKDKDVKYDLKDWNIPYSFLTNDVKNVMSNPFYFPTERGLQSIFSLGNRPNLNDKLFEQLAELSRISASFKEETAIEPLNLIYKNVDGEGYIKTKGEDSFVRLAQGASGFKSAIPIVLVLKYFSLFENRKRTFLIEEPEQNLLSTSQKRLMEFLVEYVNEFGHSLLITTHSPYILTALENLMMAEKVGTENEGIFKGKTNKIVEEKYWIDQKEINAYYLNEGQETDLMLREDTLIDKDYIDAASDMVNESFEEFLRMEFQLEKMAG